MIVQLKLHRRSRHTERARPLSEWAEATWADLRGDTAVETFLSGARAASTQATYEVQRRQFLRFCDELGVRGEDCFTADVLSRWIMGRSVNHYKLSTIELGLYAVADWLPARSILSEPAVLQALRAAARQPSAQQQR